jgi:hypothetical protein
MVQRIGRHSPEVESEVRILLEARGTDLAGAGGSPQNCRWPVRLRPVSPMTLVLTLWTAGDGWQMGESMLTGYRS